MTQKALRDALESMAAMPGLEGCALVEIEAGMVWHHAGQIEGVQTFAEAASDYWRLYNRLSHQFKDLTIAFKMAKNSSNKACKSPQACRYNATNRRITKPSAWACLGLIS